MKRWVRGALALMLATAPMLLAACGGGTAHKNAPGSAHLDGLVSVREVKYRSSFDGSSVTGLFAVPRALQSQGCVIWEFGLGSSAQDSSAAWQGLAQLGLSTFSIDIRDNGARASPPDEWQQVVHSPSRLAAMISGTVGDLRSAVTYLEGQPECEHTVAYAGVSLGGVLGSILAGTDPSIRAVALIATPGSFKAVLTTPGTQILPGVARHPGQMQAALRILSPLNPDRYVGRIAPRPVLILSGLDDKTVDMANSLLLQRAAREPKVIRDYHGGHNPVTGKAGAQNSLAVTSFLLRYVVEPKFGIHGRDDGTFLVQ